MIDTMGHLASNSPIVEFREVRVPLSNMIGKPGDGLQLAKGAFSWTSSSIWAAAVGKVRAAFEIAYNFVKTEKRSGRVPVIEHQNAGYMLADIKTRIEAARYFAWKASDHFDKTGGLDRELSNMVKIFNSELSVQTVYDAMRLVGVDSYGDRSPLGKVMQDVLCLPLYDGGNMGGCVGGTCTIFSVTPTTTPWRRPRAASRLDRPDSYRVTRAVLRGGNAPAVPPLHFGQNGVVVFCGRVGSFQKGQWPIASRSAAEATLLEARFPAVESFHARFRMETLHK